ncbi:MAG: dTDP-4-dehydrorhamnose reductase [Proteobacteria bacterium]|nr:dTDP-4-dehydrorhamnose reductase [Pseudomonadota bacterium]
MTVLVFGQSGQVGSELARLAPDARVLSRAEADLSDPQACDRAIRHLKPRAVINAAAYTAVDRAETEMDLAHIINGNTPGAMARAAREIGAVFVHISTDYVFDGSGDRPWRPDDPTAPINAYGQTKRQGEEAVRAAGGVHAILRTSWVFSAFGQNFLKTMLRLGDSRPALSVVGDQVGGPTPAASIAVACLTIAERLHDRPDLTGTYHFSGAPDVSWHGFARAIFGASGQTPEVTAIPSSDYPTPATRPMNSRLDCSATETAFGIPRPDWRIGLRQVLSELGHRS